MSDFGRIDGRDLDRYITGNHGEDSVSLEPNQRVRLEGHGEFWLVGDDLAAPFINGIEMTHLETAEVSEASYARLDKAQNTIMRYGEVIAKVTDLQPIEEFTKENS